MIGGVLLTPETERRIELLFRPGDREAVRTILVEQCGDNIPGWESAGLERLHFAVLKRSDGDLAELQKAVDLAKRDFRDALVWVGFGEPYVHRRWRPRQKW
jgi:hypothetical protein